jgi:hypothetical protein
MVFNPAKQFNQFGSGPVVRAVVDDQNALPLLTGQAIEKSIKFYCQCQNEFSPVVPGALQNLVGSVFAETDIFVDDDATEEVLPDKRQCEYRLYQRANMVSVPFSDTGSIHQCANREGFKKCINLAVYVDRILRLGGIRCMVHLSPFFLILLCFFANPL